MIQTSTESQAICRDSPCHYNYIDALRGIAILAVLLIHSSQWVTPSSRFLMRIIRDGRTGVQLFFLTSALALCHSMNARQRVEQNPVRNFFVRRFFRLAPMFYLAMAWYLLERGFGVRDFAPDGIQWWHILLAVIFQHGWHPATFTSIVPGSWSVAVESGFYLLFPLFWRAIKSTTAAVLFLACIIIINLWIPFLLVMLFATSFSGDREYMLAFYLGHWLVAQLPVFAMGFFCYHITRVLPFKRQSTGYCMLFCSALVLTAASSLSRHVLSSQPYIFYNIAFLMLAIGLSANPIQLLVNRFTVWIGKISYSMYLVHFAILPILTRHLPAGFHTMGDMAFVLFYVMMITVTSVISTVTYHYIELPGIHVGRRIISSWEHGVASRS